MNTRTAVLCFTVLAGLSAGSGWAADKPRIAVFSGPTSTIQKHKPLIPSSGDCSALCSVAYLVPPTAVESAAALCQEIFPTH